MKPLTKQGTLLLLATIMAIALITPCVLLAAGIIDSKVFVVSFVIWCMLVIVVVAAFLYKYPVTVEPYDVFSFNPYSVELPRTAMSTTVEIITGFFIIAASIMAIMSNQFLHMIPLIFCTGYELIDAYSPGRIFLGGRLSNARQVPIAANMKRIIALELSLLCIMISIPEGFSPTWMGIGMLVALFLTYVIFRIAIYQTE